MVIQEIIISGRGEGGAGDQLPWLVMWASRYKEAFSSGVLKFCSLADRDPNFIASYLDEYRSDLDELGTVEIRADEVDSSNRR